MTNAIGTQAIGETFSRELAAAGLTLPVPGFSWGAYGLDPFPASMTTAQITIVEQVFQSHNPNTVLPNWPGFIEWISANIPAATKNALANSYGLFFGAAVHGNAADVQWCLTDANSKGLLSSTLTIGGTTQTLYQWFQYANGPTVFNLEMTLP